MSSIGDGVLVVVAAAAASATGVATGLERAPSEKTIASPTTLPTKSTPTASAAARLPWVRVGASGGEVLACLQKGGFVRMNLRGQRVDSRPRAPLLLTGQPPRDDAHDNGDRNRQDGYDEQGNHRYLNLNSTATSTVTSTGVPCRRAGENRHWRTAWTARSLSPPPSPLNHLQITNRSVPSDDDFQDDLAGEPFYAGVFGVVRFYLAQQLWRLDPASRTIDAATSAAAGTGSDSRALALADSRSGSRPCAATAPRSTAVFRRRRSLQDAVAVPRIGRDGDQWRDDRWAAIQP